MSQGRKAGSTSVFLQLEAMFAVRPEKPPTYGELALRFKCSHAALRSAVCRLRRRGVDIVVSYRMGRPRKVAT